MLNILILFVILNSKQNVQDLYIYIYNTYIAKIFTFVDLSLLLSNIIIKSRHQSISYVIGKIQGEILHKQI